MLEINNVTSPASMTNAVCSIFFKKGRLEAEMIGVMNYEHINNTDSSARYALAPTIQCKSPP